MPQITYTPDETAGIADAVATAVIERLTAASGLIGGTGESERIAFGEAEAAAMIGLPRTALRDARLRGLVRPAKVGKRFLYPRQMLIRLAAGLPPESAERSAPVASGAAGPLSSAASCRPPATGAASSAKRGRRA